MVDLRPDSPTRNRWLGVELSSRDGRLAYVPEGFAQGYQTLEDDTEVHYSMSHRYVPEAARGVRWDDPGAGHRLAPGGPAHDLGPRPGVARADGAVTGTRSGGASVSIVCVFNDPEVRRACLDRSLEAHRARGGRSSTCRSTTSTAHSRPRERRSITVRPGRATTTSPSSTRTSTCTRCSALAGWPPTSSRATTESASSAPSASARTAGSPAASATA